MFRYTGVASALILSLLPWAMWLAYVHFGGIIASIITVFTVTFPIGVVGTSTRETRAMAVAASALFPAALWLFWYACYNFPGDGTLAWLTALSLLFFGSAYVSAMSLIQKGD